MRVVVIFIAFDVLVELVFVASGVVLRAAINRRDDDRAEVLDLLVDRLVGLRPEVVLDALGALSSFALAIGHDDFNAVRL